MNLLNKKCTIFEKLFGRDWYASCCSLRVKGRSSMKPELQKNECGSEAINSESTPAKEVLEEQGAIFSCGGVYLGLNRPSVPMEDRFDFLFSPGHGKKCVLFNHGKMHRRAGEKSSETISPQGQNSPQETLKRFFRESLN